MGVRSDDRSRCDSVDGQREQQAAVRKRERTLLGDRALAGVAEENVEVGPPVGQCQLDLALEAVGRSRLGRQVFHPDRTGDEAGSGTVTGAGPLPLVRTPLLEDRLHAPNGLDRVTPPNRIPGARRSDVLDQRSMAFRLQTVLDELLRIGRRRQTNDLDPRSGGRVMTLQQLGRDGQDQAGSALAQLPRVTRQMVHEAAVEPIGFGVLQFQQKGVTGFDREPSD